MTFRRELLEVLRMQAWTLQELARELRVGPRELEEDIRHLMRSARRGGYRIRVEPASCRKCGFRFRDEHLRKPGKCPSCRGTWIEEPTIAAEDFPRS